jgi:hypothetical protein
MSKNSFMGDVYVVGHFYNPYVPLYVPEPVSVEEYMKRRRNFLLQCPSHPFSCTGECKTEDYKKFVEDSIKSELEHLRF